MAYPDLAGYRAWARRWVRQNLAVRWSTVRWVLKSWRPAWRSCQPALQATGSGLLEACRTILTKSASPVWSHLWPVLEARSKDDTLRYYANVFLAVMLALVDLSLLGWDVYKARDFFVV